MTAILKNGGWLRIAILSLFLFLGACGNRTETQAPQQIDQKSQGDRSNLSQTVPAIEAKATPTGTVPFRSQLEINGIKFLVESPNSLVGNTVTVEPSGLANSNESFTSPVSGEVLDVQAGDLNVDQSPEVYVFVRERDGIERINVVAYAVNDRKSMSEFALPEPDLKSKEYVGYNGSDKFEVVENVLSRRFPLFEEVGGQFRKTGKTRIIQYKIKPGEATWQFYVKRFDDF